MKDIKVKIDYTPLLKAIEEQNLSENKIFKQWNIPRKTFYNIRHERGITIDKDIGQLVNISYDIIEKPE